MVSRMYNDYHREAMNTIKKFPFIYLFLSYMVTFAIVELSCIILTDAKDRAYVSSGTGEAVPEDVSKTLARGRGRSKGDAHGVAQVMLMVRH